MQVVHRRRAWAAPSVRGSFPSMTSFIRIIFPRALVMGLLVKSKMGQTALQKPQREHCVMALRRLSSHFSGLVIISPQKHGMLENWNDGIMGKPFSS